MEAVPTMSASRRGGNTQDHNASNFNGMQKDAGGDETTATSAAAKKAAPATTMHGR